MVRIKVRIHSPGWSFGPLGYVLPTLGLLLWLVGLTACAVGSGAAEREMSASLLPDAAASSLQPALMATEADAVSVPETTFREHQLPGNVLQHFSFVQTQDNELQFRLEASEAIAWRTAPARQGQIRIVFRGLSSPAHLTKLHQLHAFGHPVKTALLRSTTEGSELLMTATGRVSVQSDELPGALILRIIDPSEAQTNLEKTPPSASPGRSAPQEGQGVFVEGAIESRQAEEERTLFPGMRDDYSGELISIDLQNAEVEHVLRLIGEVAGYNLILDAGVGGRISMKLENVPWDQVLDLVLVQKNLGMVVRGNILRISTAQQLESERDQLRRAREATMQEQETIQRLEPLQTAYIQINYATAMEMDARTRPFLTERGKLSVDPRTNTLIVTDSPLQIRQIQGMIDRLDRPERQVLIEARVVYATDDFQRGMGIQWGGGIEGITTEYYRGVYGGAGGAPINQGGVAQTGYLVNTPLAALPTFGIGAFISKLVGPDMFTLDAQLQLAELKNTAKTVSSPRVVTLNNQRAEIEQGTRVAIQVTDERGTRTDFVDAVLKLAVMPQITPDNKLILDLEIRDDNPVGQDIDTKTTRTRLMVDDGQTLVLGGVLKATEERLENRVPGLADIPGLGWLFKSRLDRARNQELLIFIRPSIL